MANDLVRTVAVANTDGLNVRESPNTESPVVTQIRQGEELDYLETIDGWVKVAVRQTSSPPSGCVSCSGCI